MNFEWERMTTAVLNSIYLETSNYMYINKIIYPFIPFQSSKYAYMLHTCSCESRNKVPIELFVHRNPIFHVSYTFSYLLNLFHQNVKKCRKVGKKRVGGHKVI